jgi:putative redox protein
MEPVIVSLGRGLRATAEVRGHRVVLDEPVSIGGSDEGPTPTEALLSALGGCTAMTLRMYAERKQWDLRAVRVSVGHSRLRRSECPGATSGDIADPAELVDWIQRGIELDGDLTDAQVERLMDIANKCPVHRILTQHAVVTSQVRRVQGA